MMNASDGIRHQIQDYSCVLDRLESRFRNRLWITGGWARTQFLNGNYAGDVDCIIFGTTSEILTFLHTAGFETQGTPLSRISYATSSETQNALFWCARIALPDRNHLDIMVAVGSSQIEAVLAKLEAFNFSINSIAINYSTNQCLRTAYNIEDANRAAFRVNDNYDICRNERVLSRDFEMFEKYYGFRSVETPLTTSLKACKDSLLTAEARQGHDDFLIERGQMLLPYIPTGAEAWIVRGAVRVALLGETKYWDDMDIVVDCERRRIFDHLNKIGTPFSLNMFGSPKIVVDNGIKVDIWGMESADSISGELARYSHNLDLIAWSIRRQNLIDPLGVVARLRNRELDLNQRFIASATIDEGRYAALKSIYLIIRHRLTFTDSVSALLRRSLGGCSPFLRKHLIRLVRELCLCVPRNHLELSMVDLEKALGTSDAINVVRHYWPEAVHVSTGSSTGNVLHR